MTDTTQARKKELQVILSRLSDFYKVPTTKLALHLIQEHKYSHRMVAEVLGMKRPAFEEGYLGMKKNRRGGAHK